MMRNRMARRGLAMGLVVLVSYLLLTADASARGERHSGSSDAGMQDVVEAVNAMRGSVTIGNETFVVSGSSRLFDARGGRIRLIELRATRNTGEGDLVEYWVRSAAEGDAREILRLRVLAEDYE